MTTKDTISNIPSKCAASALQLGPRKKISTSDPLISHRRHFGRTVFALGNYPSLLTNGILRLEQMEDFSADLLECLQNGSEEEILHVGELVHCKGAAGARGDDTKMLKSAILDWIAPKGAAIQPPLHRNSKIDRSQLLSRYSRFNHELTGSLLCPAGLDRNDTQTRENLRSSELSVCRDQWPIFLFAHHTYDTEDPWCGLLRSRLLVCVRFAISSSSVFSRTDTTMDSETFYHSLLDLFEDPDESKEVEELLTWWNRQVFPTSSAAKRSVSTNSALSKIRLKRLAAKQAADSNTVSS
ncbi:uncharacterized protein HD556DRAFT_1429012 [Suillus plorans]|uniref:Uncharacterized protein n=1 Tax=Suillus plorans TaxID=116603 RepID=A0A9P7J6C4_9AGAM|nr:uncharacterized protein HD556DRAFT_1429012 [Suillus plorans]KAG1804825.1 hypothetical protein HD556DRAFT_1429012 [Suillus plorans]